MQKLKFKVLDGQKLFDIRKRPKARNLENVYKVNIYSMLYHHLQRLIIVFLK